MSFKRNMSSLSSNKAQKFEIFEDRLFEDKSHSNRCPVQSKTRDCQGGTNDNDDDDDTDLWTLSVPSSVTLST